MQIDSGPYGLVWGVTKSYNVYCRVGITVRNSKGSGWHRVKGKLKYVSVGQFGTWGVNSRNYIYYRYGVSRVRPYGKTDLYYNLLK